MDSRKSKLLSQIDLALIIAQIFVIFGSWVWSAATPESNIRSLLSSSGIRWFFGTFTANIGSTLLVWIIILDIAVGSCIESGMLNGFKRLFSGDIHPQQRSGLRAALSLLIIEILILLILTLPAHAILLSITGTLFPSSFSVSIIPTVAFIAITMSVSYGLFSGTLHNYKDTFNCIFKGGSNLKALLIIYILAAELFYMVIYVINV